MPVPAGKIITKRTGEMPQTCHVSSYAGYG